MGVSSVQRLLIFCFIGILISSSCASHKQVASTRETVELQPAPAVVQDTVKPVKTVIKEEPVKVPYTIRLLLPLRLAEHFENDTVPDLPLLYDNTINALQFYLGALAAADSLKDLSVDLKIEVVDVSGDSLEVINKLKQKAFRHADLALSMLSPQFLDVAVKAAAEAKCQLVLQGASNTQLLSKYSNIWLATPANSTQLGMMSEYLVKENAASEFIIFTRKTRSENVLASYMATRMDSLAGKKLCKLVEFNKDTWDVTQKTFPKNKKIILIIPTQDESYLQSILNKLKDMDAAYLFQLVGLPNWENFESVDPEALAEYNATIFNSLYIDVDQPSARKFRSAFIDVNHTDAQQHAFQAYDLITYFVTNFIQYEKNYGNYKSPPVFELPQKGFHFLPVCNECGYENSSVNILRFGNYKLNRIAEFQR